MKGNPIKPCCSLLTACLNLSLALAATATPHYVDVNGTNAIPPYLDWSTAATNIQDAVDAALAGDEVVVTNGIYATGGRAAGTNIIVNRVAVDKLVTVRSVNGPAFTIIQGYQVPGTTNGDGAIRCVYLTNGANLFGFTLTNGATRSTGDAFAEMSGGGVWRPSDSVVGIVSNCVLVGNAAYRQGGGALFARFDNCAIVRNIASSGGGTSNCTLTNCLVRNNIAFSAGGGAGGGQLKNCTLSENLALGGGGGGASGSIISGCLVVSNSALSGGGFSGGDMRNCTVVGNSGGGVEGPGFYWNCIIYYNFKPGSSASNYSSGTYFSCCTMPLPLSVLGNITITNEPLFANAAIGDYRLQTNSPCINAGWSIPATTSDLDGNPRIVNGTADIGAYEYQGSGSLISYAWLQQYGWPTDGSADSLDPDGDGMNNWQEWRADTIPTDPNSSLRILSVTNGTPGLKVTWQSAKSRFYWLERATNFSLAQPFLKRAQNISGGASSTTYSDTTATSGGPYYYRVGVQPN